VSILRADRVSPGSREKPPLFLVMGTRAAKLNDQVTDHDHVDNEENNFERSAVEVDFPDLKRDKGDRDDDREIFRPTSSEP